MGSEDNAILHLRRQGQDLDPFGTNFGALAPKGCIAERGDNPDNCVTVARGLEGASSVAASDDGKFVYVTGFEDNAIVTFKRRYDGDLDRRGCIADPTLNPAHCKRTAEGLAGAYDVEVRFDKVFVAGYNDSAVVAFHRDEQTGRLTPRGCVSDPGQHTGCARKAKGLLLVHGLATSVNGLYAVGNGANSIVRFTFDDNGALHPRDCIASPVGNTEGCRRTADGLAYASSVIVSPYPDETSVYVASQIGAIVRFDADRDSGGRRLAGASTIPSTASAPRGRRGSAGSTRWRSIRTATRSMQPDTTTARWSSFNAIKAPAP